jgi:hypothetical protein
VLYAVVPTYNEAANVEKLVRAVQVKISGVRLDVAMGSAHS